MLGVEENLYFLATPSRIAFHVVFPAYVYASSIKYLFLSVHTYQSEAVTRLLIDFSVVVS